jgi:hypothetical protein
MGRAAAVRQSGIRVRDGTNVVAAARRCGGEEGAEEIRRFFCFFITVWGKDEWMSGHWVVSWPTIGTVWPDIRHIPSITDHFS